MVVFNVFSESVKYNYKTNVCSYGTLVLFFTTTLTISVPIIIIHLTGGFWIRNNVYTEIPDVIFKHKYFFLAESKENINPVVCSTFRTHKENRISDSCTMTKVQELDFNKDGLNDVLKFELHFFTKHPINFMRLLLFFNYELKEKTELTMEATAALHYAVPIESQKLIIIGELRLNQRSLLNDNGAHDIYNYSADINDQSLLQLLTDNVGRKLTTRVENGLLTWERGFTPEEETVVQVELFYSEEVIHYRPAIWEELKWAWIQYFALFFALAYVARYITKFVFVNRYVHSYVILPWEDK